MRASKRTAVRFAALFASFFALYALTAQRGLGWGDSGQFQSWALGGADIYAAAGFSNLHPLYLAFARAVSATPFHVTLVSSFFGAGAVLGLALCTGSALLAALFGLSHMVWWLSCVAEVQTMNLALTAFGALAFVKWLENGKGALFASAAFLAGVQLEVHNFALLVLPVYAAAAFFRKLGFKWMCISAALFAIGASYWLYALFTRGLSDVLVGAYGAKVAGFMPSDWRTAAFNLALASMSFAVPAILAIRRGFKRSPFIIAMLAIHALFLVRYFVPDQATFLLPTLFFAYLSIRCETPSRRETHVLAGLQLLMPAIAFLALNAMPVDSERASRHPHRNDAAYFALPWKFLDDSADRCASELGGAWDGYNAERAMRK